MKRITSCVFALVVTTAYADPIVAGIFTTPISPNEAGTGCTPGYRRDQYTMERNDDLKPPKYHMGEDLNGICNDPYNDTDYSIHAIGEGQVVFMDDVGTVTGQGKRLYIRHSIPYSKASSGNLIFDIAMLHLNSMAQGISWNGAGTGTQVTAGQPVAYLGGTGGVVPHLHWEMQVNLSIPIGINPYQTPLTISHALKYRAPSLVVDDRKYVLGYQVPQPGGWYSFTINANAPSSIMYIERYGERKTLKQAIAAGWIPSEAILNQQNGSWYYKLDVDDNFFEAGKTYAIKTLVTNVKHFILVPQHNYKDDRARYDMVQAMSLDSRFYSVKTETYSFTANWVSGWDLHVMQFNLSDGRTAWANQATNTSNPLIRLTCYFDPDTQQWTEWKQVSWNQLY